MSPRYPLLSPRVVAIRPHMDAVVLAATQQKFAGTFSNDQRTLECEVCARVRRIAGRKMRLVEDAVRALHDAIIGHLIFRHQHHVLHLDCALAQTSITILDRQPRLSVTRQAATVYAQPSLFATLAGSGYDDRSPG